MKTYKRMFALAALWNIVAGVCPLIFFDFFIELLYGRAPGNTMIGYIIFTKFFFAAVIIFGIGYYFVSMNPALNRGIVVLGLLSKMIIFTTIFSCFFLGIGTLFFLALVTGDFLWSIAFFMFLWQTRDQVKVNNLIG